MIHCYRAELNCSNIFGFNVCVLVLVLGGTQCGPVQRVHVTMRVHIIVVIVGGVTLSPGLVRSCCYFPCEMANN